MLKKNKIITACSLKDGITVKTVVSIGGMGLSVKNVVRIEL